MGCCGDEEDEVDVSKKTFLRFTMGSRGCQKIFLWSFPGINRIIIQFGALMTQKKFGC